MKRIKNTLTPTIIQFFKIKIYNVFREFRNYIFHQILFCNHDQDTIPQYFGNVKKKILGINVRQETLIDLKTILGNPYKKRKSWTICLCSKGGFYLMTIQKVIWKSKVIALIKYALTLFTFTKIFVTTTIFRCLYEVDKFE